MSATNFLVVMNLRQHFYQNPPFLASSLSPSLPSRTARHRPERRPALLARSLLSQLSRHPSMERTALSEGEAPRVPEAAGAAAHL